MTTVAVVAGISSGYYHATAKTRARTTVYTNGSANFTTACLKAKFTTRFGVAVCF
ncbi:MAG: hypothetical protein AAGJ55_06210 [Cyanobacteria bacterium J06555_12]